MFSPNKLSDGHVNPTQVDITEESDESIPTSGFSNQDSTDGNATAMEVPSYSILQDALSGYEIGSLIHHGAQGAVYEAIQKTTRRKVAVKVMKGNWDLEGRSRIRFEQEVRLMATLKHPNIVTIHESGQTADHLHYYIMEYVSGKSLDLYLTQGKSANERYEEKEMGIRLSIRHVVLLFAKICDAVNAAHLRGIIHRDLKPSNILIDSQGEPFILDFGLAKVAAGLETDSIQTQSLTFTGQFVGSIPWASPEQVQGVPEDIDVRTDIYSMGVLLYQMLTGCFPYPVHCGVREVLDHILTTEPMPPSARRNDIDDELETIILKCLQKQPNRRYQDAGQLYADIKRYLTGEAIEAKRDSILYLLQKGFRRYRLPLIIWMGFMGLMATSLAVSIFLWRQAADEREIAREAQLEEHRQRQAAETARQLLQAEKDKADHAVYLTSIGLAQKYMQEGRFADVLKLLIGCPSQFRNWEWGYLIALCNPDLMTFTGHGNQVWSVLFTPDGRHLVSAGFDGTVRLWDVRNGMEVSRLQGSFSPLYCLTISPDGQKIATAGKDGVIWIWNKNTGERLLEIKGHNERIMSLTFSPDGKSIGSAGGNYRNSRDNSIRLWDADSGRPIWRSPDFDRCFYDMEYSPDGRTLAVVAENVIRLFDTSTRKMTVWDGANSLGARYSVAFSPDGLRLAAGATDFFRIYDLKSGKSLLKVNLPGSGAIWSIAFHPGGRRVATACEDTTVRIVDLTQPSSHKVLRGHSGRVVGIAFHPDGSRLASAGSDHQVKIWAADKTLNQTLLTGHSGPVNSLAFNRSGELLVTGGQDGAIHLWNEGTGRSMGIITAVDRPIKTVALNGSGSRLAVGHSQGVSLFDTHSGSTIRLPDPIDCSVGSIAMNSDGNLLAAACWEKQTYIWNLDKSKRISLQGVPKMQSWGVAISPDNQFLATAGISPWVALWDITLGEKVKDYGPRERTVHHVAFSINGRWLAAAGYDNMIKIYDLIRGSVTGELKGFPWAPLVAVFSSDGSRLATVTGDEKARDVKLWETETGTDVFSLSLSNISQSLAFRPNGLTLAIALNNGNTVLFRAFPWKNEDYPGTSETPVEKRIELYKRQNWLLRFQQ